MPSVSGMLPADLDPFDLTLLYTLKRSGTLPGKKAIQKLVYFLKEVGLPVRFRFQWDKFGPYSQELAYYIDDLVAEGLVKSSPTTIRLPQHQAEGVQYNFSVTEKGGEILSEVNLSRDETAKIQEVLKLVREVSPQNLELYASVHYLVKFYSTKSERMRFPEGLDDLMDLYKPGRFTSQQVKAVYHILKQHGLL